MYGGKDTIIVIPQFQIDGMVEVMDFILSHPYRYSVEQIKQQFNLNENEFRMIYEFCMPHERHRANERFWVMKYRSVYGAVGKLVENMKSNHHRMISIDKLETILKNHGIGKQNEECHEAYDEEDEDEI